MCAIAEIGCSIERVQAAIICIERILIAEIVVTDKELMLFRDGPVKADIDPLRVLDSLRGCQEIGRNTDQCSVGGADGRRRWSGAFDVLVGSEKKQLVFDETAARVRREVVGCRDGSCGSGQYWAGDGVERATNELHLPMKLIAPRAGDDIVNVTSDFSELGREAV